MRNALRVVALLANVGSLAACHRAEQLRADGCPVEPPRAGSACAIPPGHWCSPSGERASSYQCECTQQHVWSCVSAGGPLPPPEC